VAEAHSPAQVVADLLGMRINAAVTWGQSMKRDWYSFVAAKSKGSKPTPELGIPSREVGGVRSCREQKAIEARGQDLSSPSLTWVRKTISLPGRSGASRTSRTLNP
jgi:hypothetical protein